MIKVSFHSAKPYQIKVLGHAKSPIVCAAVSAVCQQLIFFADSCDGIDEMEYKMYSGDTRVEIDGSIEADVAFQMTKQGLENLSRTFPKEIEIVGEI